MLYGPKVTWVSRMWNVLHDIGRVDIFCLNGTALWVEATGLELSQHSTGVLGRNEATTVPANVIFSGKGSCITKSVDQSEFISGVAR